MDEILARAAADLHARRAQGRPPVELAFYGGTFTALAPRDLDACLDMAEGTRLHIAMPDACPPDASPEVAVQLAQEWFAKYGHRQVTPEEKSSKLLKDK